MLPEAQPLACLYIHSLSETHVKAGNSHGARAEGILGRGILIFFPDFLLDYCVLLRTADGSMEESKLRKLIWSNNPCLDYSLHII